MESEIQLAEAAGIDADDTGEHAEDVVIDLDLSWLNSLEEKLASTRAKSSPSFTICRVPAHIRDSYRAAYGPSIISIGPFHRQSTNLQAMEEHKWRYLDKVLRRSKTGNDLGKYLKEMKAKEAQARNCYSENIILESNKFVEMMVLDGCFVLQFIHEENENAQNNDPIYHNDWMFGRISNDMLLLENQLPFFVLECQWELMGQPRATLRNEALTFFRRAFPYEHELKCPEEPDIHHLLHAVHLSLRPAQPARKPRSMSTATGKLSCLQLCKDMGKILPFLSRLVETRDTSTPAGQQSLLENNPPSLVVKMVPCAMELQEAGFRFQRKQARSFFDVTFEKGLMKMPCLCIDDYTNAVFRNFIAFEQCFPEWRNHFTSYCFLIDALVNTPRDVSILTHSNIIEHMLGSDEEVALLFNKLCKEIFWDFERSYLANMFEEVNQHTQKRWPKWRAKLVHDYFSNPWAIISVIAAIIILIVALVQTFYAVFAYFRPPKP